MPPSPETSAIDPDADVRLQQRRSRRLTGKELALTPPGTALSLENTISEGPELVASAAPLPAPTRRSEAKRTSLLDAAELLFSKWSYTGVSVRDVTDVAGTRLGDVNYYFGSKQNLYFEVLRRRAEPLSRARVEAIAAAVASEKQGADFVEALVDAYMMPALDLSENGGPGWRNFFQLIGHVTFSRLWPDEIMTRYFNEPAERFIDALGGRFPEVSAFQRQAASLLIIGPVIFILARTGRIETFNQPSFTSNDLTALTPVTRTFVARGVCGVLGIPA